MSDKADQPKEKKLTLRQEKFCELYASDQEFFGNGVQTHMEVYGSDYKTAQVSAHRMLRNAKILKGIDEHLEALQLNDQHMDKQLGFWATQKENGNVAVAAIKEYNALKKRITKQLEVHDFRETRSKIGGFLDDTDDGLYDDGGAKPTATDPGSEADQVAQSTTDIS